MNFKKKRSDIRKKNQLKCLEFDQGKRYRFLDWNRIPFSYNVWRVKSLLLLGSAFISKLSGYGNGIAFDIESNAGAGCFRLYLTRVWGKYYWVRTPLIIAWEVQKQIGRVQTNNFWYLETELELHKN